MTVHLLRSGSAACSLRGLPGPQGVPNDWPAGETWSREPANVTCPGCLARTAEEYATEDATTVLRGVDELYRQIAPLLSGRGPGVQGALLADMVAMWVAGHAPELRDQVLDAHVDLVRRLMVINARAIAKRTGIPEWSKEREH